MTAEPNPASELSYNQAAAELEDLLAELDSETIDIDKLSARVRRVAELIRVCRERIAGARLEIERVVAELDDAAERALEPDDGTDDDAADPDHSEDPGHSEETA